MKSGLRRRALLSLTVFLGITAAAGGVAMLAGWISVPLSSLAGSPFTDFTVPALLLLAAVGFPALLAAWLVHLRTSAGIAASTIAGGSIIVFEIVEWNIIGFSWLLAIYLGIGATILLLAGANRFGARTGHRASLERHHAG